MRDPTHLWRREPWRVGTFPFAFTANNRDRRAKIHQDHTTLPVQDQVVGFEIHKDERERQTVGSLTWGVKALQDPTDGADNL